MPKHNTATKAPRPPKRRLDAPEHAGHQVKGNIMSEKTDTTPVAAFMVAIVTRDHNCILNAFAGKTPDEIARHAAEWVHDKGEYPIAALRSIHVYDDQFRILTTLRNIQLNEVLAALPPFQAYRLEVYPRDHRTLLFDIHAADDDKARIKAKEVLAKTQCAATAQWRLLRVKDDAQVADSFPEPLPVAPVAQEPPLMRCPNYGKWTKCASCTHAGDHPLSEVCGSSAMENTEPCPACVPVWWT